jgi:hypothetical protein
MAADIENLLNTAQAPELGPHRRPGTKSIAEIDNALGANANPLVRATVLLWHDHLDEAHTVAQAFENPDGSYLHGIVHRREPDYSNAKYWFRRVGLHPCFDSLVDAADLVLESTLSEHDKQAPPLIVKGKWDPFAFIDACEAANSGQRDEDLIKALQQIQAAELSILLKEFHKSSP